MSGDSATGRFNCSSSSGNFCAGDSLQTNCVFRCGSGYGTLGNCNDTLAGRPPIRVKSFASCKGYQTSPTAGDAVCKYDCVISDNNGTQILVSDCTGTPIASARSGLPSYLARQATDYLTEAEIPPYPIRDNATHRNATGTAALRATPSNYTNNAASGFLRGYAVLAAALASVSSL
ncbi:MAG: hypothetical protein M1815_004316 [Lichina confinis]|nr:MAG: hypothetical protein M1815_004316 [Lichina confinis]